MNNIEDEINDISVALGYLCNNLDKQPLMIQLKFMESVLKFDNELKLLYIAALAMERKE